jgi:hypothetical protein
LLCMSVILTDSEEVGPAGAVHLPEIQSNKTYLKGA